MFNSTSNNRLSQPRNKLAYVLAACAGVAILAGTVAVSAQTATGAAKSDEPAAITSQSSVRPLTIGLRGSQPARQVRVIKIYSVSDDQKKFGNQ